ncbi:type-F conjugative transfer system protein TraW [Sphingomonas sp. H39-1-10]|uniref:type-F conjugative transfer system protein TraW n=1 Tax=Sphingomonas pollutisoli TaxID=3030829 RepID=UPI0023B99CAB|nr:type-F conjugative transfer system protein TraW [Sphingomonas pollutisoli]MDF0490462.1 type-F conjugative transfer system protein TraW [Sphingomonas pollutisoli]
MRRRARAGAAVLLALLGLSSSQARDLGVLGQTFPIVEPDLLATIEAKLRRLEQTGGIAAANAEFARRAERHVRRPRPVDGIAHATEARSWTFDPAITLESDIRDHKGNLIAARGARVNPLDFVTVRQDLVFVDGDDARQMDWATATYGDAKAKIILVAGSPIDAMTARRRRFYFDQEGRLTARFGIRHVPAIVTQDGKAMRVREVPLKPKGAG